MVSLKEIEDAFTSNAKRRRLFTGLKLACIALRDAGCTRLYVDGSFVTAKPVPGDYDICWDPAGVDPNRLDPVFLNFEDKRRNQKLKYGGEFFPFTWQVEPGKTFFEYFQNDRFTGQPKGILSVDLTCEPLE